MSDPTKSGAASDKIVVVEAFKQALLIVTSDDRDSWRLSGAPPLPPTPPGQRLVFTHLIQDVACDVLRFIVCASIEELGVRSLAPPRINQPSEPKEELGSCVDWRIDKITIDGIDVLDAPRPASYFAASAVDPMVPFAKGIEFIVHATNTSTLPAYFYAKFILISERYGRLMEVER